MTLVCVSVVRCAPGAASGAGAGAAGDGGAGAAVSGGLPRIPLCDVVVGPRLSAEGANGVVHSGVYRTRSLHGVAVAELALPVALKVCGLVRGGGWAFGEGRCRCRCRCHCRCRCRWRLRRRVWAELCVCACTCASMCA